MSATRRTLCLTGAGHVGAGPEMLHQRHGELAVQYGVDLSVSGVAGLGGCAAEPAGLDLGRGYWPIKAR